MLFSWVSSCNSLCRVHGDNAQCQKLVTFLWPLQREAQSLLTSSAESTSSWKEWSSLRGMKSSFVKWKNKSWTGVPIKYMGIQLSRCNKIPAVKLLRIIWLGSTQKSSSNKTYWQFVPSREGMWKICRENTLLNKNRRMLQWSTYMSYCMPRTCWTMTFLNVSISKSWI